MVKFKKYGATLWLLSCLGVLILFKNILNSPSLSLNIVIVLTGVLCLLSLVSTMSQNGTETGSKTKKEKGTGVKPKNKKTNKKGDRDANISVKDENLESSKTKKRSRNMEI